MTRIGRAVSWLAVIAPIGASICASCASVVEADRAAGSVSGSGGNGNGGSGDSNGSGAGSEGGAAPSAGSSGSAGGVGGNVAQGGADTGGGGVIDPFDGGSGPNGSCKDLAKFEIEVVPAMQVCADMCHAGANAAATAQLDLSKLNEPAPAAACEAVRAWIVPGDPLSSEILIVTNPQQMVIHMFKFAGNLNEYNEFKSAVSPWILAEQ